jgi:hypothetical protein
MKTERILENIENLSSIQAIPANKVQIKKATTLKDLMELKARFPFLKKAIMRGDKILFEDNMLPLGQRIKAL